MVCSLHVWKVLAEQFTSKYTMEFDREQWNRLIHEIEQRNEGYHTGQLIEAALAGGGALIGGLSYGVLQNMPQSSFRGSKKRKTTEMPTVTDDEDMAMEPAPAVASALMASSGGGEKGTAKETPITVAPPTYMLQDTHTTILPITFYGSAMRLSNTSANQPEIRVRMTGLNAPLLSSYATSTNLTAAGGATANGFYDVFIKDDVPGASLKLVPPPRTTSGANGTRPAGYDYWSARYAYYTVLACHWEVVIENPSLQYLQDACVHWTYEGNTTTPAMNYDTLLYAKNVNKAIIESYGIGKKNIQVISGTYYPGMYKREVRDDTETKTWIEKSTNPSLAETLYLRFTAAPFTNIATINFIGVNVAITCKYVVQWKDLAVAYKYPNTGFLPGV